MNKKLLLLSGVLFVFGILLPVGLFAQPDYNIHELNLKGKVKRLWECFYTVENDNYRYDEQPSISHYDRRIEFDRNGNKTLEVWHVDNPARSPGEDYHIVHSFWTFTYNPKQQIEECSWFEADSTLISRWTYHYDNQGRETGFEQYDQVSDVTILHQITYNNIGKVETRTSKILPEKYSMNGYKYYYDDKGNMVKVESGYISVIEEYDEDKEIVKEIEKWEYDWCGVYEYDANNRVIYENGDGEYDTESHYKYDDEGRLIEIRKGIFDDMGYYVTTFIYDHQGNILKKNVDAVHNHNFTELESYYRPVSSLTTLENTTYQYDYDRTDGGWNWYSRLETKNGKQLKTTRDISYYEE